MELREIEIFLTLSEELHFGRTAERLHVSTARVSQTIRKLERQVGVPLFDRTSRQVSLTVTGARLRDDLGPAHTRLRDGIERAIAFGREVQGVLHVGFISVLAGRFVHDVGDLFARRHPGSRIEARENQWGDGFGRRLASGEIDVLLTHFPVREPELRCGPVLFREERLLAVSARHPFARRESVTWDDVARDRVLDAPAVPDYWKATNGPTHTRDGRPVEVGPSFGTIEEMLALVAAGRGVFAVSGQAARYYVRPDVAYLPIDDAPACEWGLIWRADRETDRVRAFVQLASEHAESLPRPGDRSPSSSGAGHESSSPSTGLSVRG